MVELEQVFASNQFPAFSALVDLSPEVSPVQGRFHRLLQPRLDDAFKPAVGVAFRRAVLLQAFDDPAPDNVAEH
ncbi:MAG: hypothetical protein QXM02_07570 [Thermoproteota archaeon]